MNERMKCSLCCGTCKRAVKLACCEIQACRGCALLKISKTRQCWREGCQAADLSSDDILNDHELRQKLTEIVNKVDNTVTCP